MAKFPNAELVVQELHDGLVLFESNLSINQLSELRFFNNVYELLADLGKTSDVNPGSLPLPPLEGTFTLRVSEENKPAIIPNGLRQRVEHETHAVFTAHNPDTELSLLYRADGRVLWGRLLPKPGFKLRHVEQGELRPQLAHILGLAAGLTAHHVVLDPFAGYGGIVREVLQGFHVVEAIAVEQNEHLIPHLKSISRLIALHGDARQLGHIHTRSIDRVITDPPWGVFDGQTELHMRKLYHESLVQIHRVLRTKGAVVMLTAVPFLPKMAAETGFELVKQYPILVSGQKATIYKLRKIG